MCGRACLLHLLLQFCSSLSLHIDEHMCYVHLFRTPANIPAGGGGAGGRALAVADPGGGGLTPARFFFCVCVWGGGVVILKNYHGPAY